MLLKPHIAVWQQFIIIFKLEWTFIIDHSELVVGLVNAFLCANVHN